MTPLFAASFCLGTQQSTHTHSHTFAHSQTHT